MRHFNKFCSECIDNCKHKSARTCPYVDYYKANKKIYRPTAINSPGLVRYGKVRKQGTTRKRVRELFEQGLRPDVIAEKLGVTLKTINYHIEMLNKKSKVKKYRTISDDWKKFWEENDAYVLELYQQGNGYRRITNILGKSNPATIRQRLIKMGAVK